MRAIGGSTPIRIAWPQIAAFSVGRILALLAALCLVSPAWALSPAVEQVLFGGVAPTWQWNALSLALPADGSVTDTSPSLGGLVLDATGALTYAPNNIITRSNDSSFWGNVSTSFSKTLIGPFGEPNTGTIWTATGNGGAYAWASLSSLTPSVLAYGYFKITGNPTWVAIQIANRDNTAYKFAWFNLANDTLGSVSGTASNVISNGSIISVGGGWHRVSLLSTGEPVAVVDAFASTADGSHGSVTTNDTLGVAYWTVSAVTYETTAAQRPGDQVVTTGSAYYGPKFDYGAGLRVWEQRRNDFLNSATGATQDVTVTATPYALSCFGSGTITLTGTSTAGPLTCAGAITGPIPSTSLLFTPTAGTLHLVVSGSATYVNLEQGAYPSPRILTYGSAVTASADVVQYAGPLLALMRGTRASLIVETNKALGTYTFQVGNASDALLQSYGSNALRTYFNCVFNSPAFNGTFAGGIVRSGVSYDGTTRTIVGNGGTPASGSCATSLGATQYLGYGLGSYYMNGYVTNVSAYNTALSPAKLQAKTVPGAQW